MFNDKFGLTKAVLEGKKTQTRRIIPESWLEDLEEFQEEYFNNTLDHIEGKDLLEQYFLIEQRKKPHFAVGETLAVAQNYLTIMDYYHSLGHISTRQVSEKELIFWNEMRRMESTGDDSAMRGDDNKMFVRADLMPYQIRITNIRLERLQDISDEDCLKEGIEPWDAAEEYYRDKGVRKSIKELKDSGITPYQIPECWACFTSPKAAYAHLIDKISGKGTWDKNPWVFVYDFELVK